MGSRVTGCACDDSTETWTVQFRDSQGREQSRSRTRDFIRADARACRGLSPEVSEEAREAADSLKYRDFLTVMLILRERNMFSDNWIYIHDPSVKVGRIQNFRSWSPEMVPDPEKACYGLEYFASSTTASGIRATNN